MAMKTVFLCCAIVLCHRGIAQADHRDTTGASYPRTIREFRCGLPLGAGLAAYEMVFIGFSYYASKPKVYGDKVMGGYYALWSAGSVCVALVYIGDKNSHGGALKAKASLTVASLGMSYGFARAANYNLRLAKGDNFKTRFKRNVAESSMAFLGSIGLGLGVAMAIDILEKRPERKAKRLKVRQRLAGRETRLVGHETNKGGLAMGVGPDGLGLVWKF